MAADSNDPFNIRIINIYAVNWNYKTPKEGTPEYQRASLTAAELKDRLRLGRLHDVYDSNIDQLPRLLGSFEGLEGAAYTTDEHAPKTFDSVRTMLFALPSYQVVVAVELTMHVVELDTAASVLDSCIRGDLNIGGAHLDEHVRGLVDRVETAKAVKNIDGVSWGIHEITPPETGEPVRALLPERHQLVFAQRRVNQDVTTDSATVKSILYREDPPYREEFAERRVPEQLNLADGRLGVVTPYVSFIYGHRQFVEDSIFLSTVHAVGTSSRFRQIWHNAYKQVRKFRDENQQQKAGAQERDDLESLADNLGNLEFDLTFSVEFPLMPIESFQSALYKALDLGTQAENLSRMFQQLGGSVQSEITAIEVREANRQKRRQRWTSFAGSALSLIGLSAGFILAYLGINAKEVSDKTSMFDPSYTKIYGIAVLLALLPALFIVYPSTRDWVEKRTDWPKTNMIIGFLLILLGIAGIGGGVVLFRLRSAVDPTVDLIDPLFCLLGLAAAFGGLAMFLRGLRWLIKKFKDE